MNRDEHQQYCGQTLNERYRVDKWLGRGGMGSVYLGTHLLIGRSLAIKILNDEFVSNPNMTARFYREAQAASLVGHKNIIEIFDVGATPQGNPFLVMEYLEGESVRSLLNRRGPLHLGLVCAIIEPVLEALSAAHAKGVVHRDLKPDNIFLAYQDTGPPIVKLIDFGISKMLDASESQESITRAGTVLGSPYYMSPEQIYGADEVDSRSDLYSVGVMLYELLTGNKPFRKSDVLPALIFDIVTGNTIHPRQSFASFPTTAEQMVMRALSTSPKDRFQTADEMLDSLKELDFYEQRQTHMATLENTGKKPSYVVGSLGLDWQEPSVDSENVAESMLDKMKAENSQERLDGSKKHSSVASTIDEQWPIGSTKSRRNKWRILAAALCFAGLMAAFIPFSDIKSALTQLEDKTLRSTSPAAQASLVPSLSAAEITIMAADSQDEYPQTTQTSPIEMPVVDEKKSIPMDAVKKKIVRPKKPMRVKQRLAGKSETQFKKGTKGTEFIEKFE